ncbi:hypothetical protein ACET3Z_014997 [Daucus carota]
MIESVVFCPCFGRKRGLKLKSQDQEDDVIDDVTVESPQYSPGLEIKQKINSEPDLELSIVENDIKAKSDAQIFTFRELATATKNFRNESIVGEGGFGPVYRGKLEKSGQVVAIKKLNEKGVQGDKEFLVEILMLSLLRHPNLVNLIGYCAEGDQRLVVYEFLPLGSLDSHLHDLEPDMEPLNWDTRMRIAYGAAKGLDYLHNDAKPQVIYRDLKSSNILLGEEYHPKLSDFGLAKFGPCDGNTHVSTRVMGTHGYCAPEYGISGKLTKRSDVFSFGVVLLEIITGRKALDTTQPRERQLIVQWALPLLRDRRDFVKLADPRLKGQFPRSSVRRAVEVALMCVQEESRARPGMREVVQALDYLLCKKYEHEGSRTNSPGSDGLRTAESESQRNMKAVGSVKSSEDVEAEKLNKERERQRAVAEAKMWGETWREKRQQYVENQFDLSSR